MSQRRNEPKNLMTAGTTKAKIGVPAIFISSTSRDRRTFERPPATAARPTGPPYRDAMSGGWWIDWLHLFQDRLEIRALDEEFTILVKHHQRLVHQPDEPGFVIGRLMQELINQFRGQPNVTIKIRSASSRAMPGERS